jgi:hypothetical protein
MRTYIKVTGVVFGLIIIAHGMRLVAEGRRLLVEPSYIITTLLAAGLCVWAFQLLRSPR